MLGRKYNVIVVEDDPMVAQIDRMYVEKTPELNVVGVFSNGLEALSFIKSGREKVDLVILDYYTPLLNGREFVSRLRSEHGNDTEVIMVTAETQFDEVRKMFSLGIVDYLIKPFDYNRFEKAIQRFLLIKIDNSKKNVNQSEIDRFFGTSEMVKEDKIMVKGIQQKTLDVILEHLKSHTGKVVTCESLSQGINLSIVTVRHYLTYLVEAGLVESQINYSTGGRPSVNYSYKA